MLNNNRIIIFCFILKTKKTLSNFYLKTLLSHLRLNHTKLIRDTGGCHIWEGVYYFNCFMFSVNILDKCI